MVGNVTIQGQITGTATFDGAKISAVVTIAPPINATVVFGKSGVTVHNQLTGRDAVDAHPKESITDLTIADSPEFANTQITTLKDVTNGGIIPDIEATWLGSTAKSVLSYLQKIVSKLYSINTRVGVLEDGYLLKYVVPVNTSAITLSIDRYGNPFNFIIGDEIIVTMVGKTSRTDLGGVVYIHPNNIRSNEYLLSGTSRYIGFFNYAAPVINNKWTLSISTQSILCILQSSRSNVDYSGITSTILSLFSKLVSDGGTVSPPITRLDFSSSDVIYAGTEIIIKKK